MVVDSDGRVEGIVSLSDILRRLVLSTADESRTGKFYYNSLALSVSRDCVALRQFYDG